MRQIVDGCVLIHQIESLRRGDGEAKNETIVVTMKRLHGYISHFRIECKG